MKKLLFVLLVIGFVSSFAQVPVHKSHDGSHNGKSSLTVVAPSPQKFWLFIDDVRQNDNPVGSVCIQHMSGRYYVRVEMDNADRNCFGQYLNMNVSHTYGITQSGACYGFEPMQGDIHPEFTFSLAAPETASQDHQGQLPPSPLQPVAMQPNSFQQAYDQIKEEAFDSSRLTLAKQVVAGNAMTATQVVQICKLFSFESNALEFAKYAYASCIDKNKYYLVNGAFKHDSSKRELNEFVNASSSRSR